MTEDNIEQSSLEIFAQIGWQVIDGRTIGPDGSGERQFTDVILNQRLKNSLRAINPGFTDNIYDEALRKIARSTTGDLLLDNYSFHQLLVNGIDIETTVGTSIYPVANGKILFAGEVPALGKTIIIEHNGMVTMYAHLSQINVTSGNVTMETVIGLSGINSNNVPALHFGKSVNNVFVNPIE